MKRLCHLPLAVLLAPAAFAAAPANIEFNGVSVEGSVIKVSLLNLITGEARWVPVGGKFGGFVISSCTATSANPVAVLTSDQGGAPRPLRLKDVAIGTAASAEPTKNAALATLNERYNASLGSIGAQLAQMRGDPNADPQQIQAMEAMQEGIRRQQQQIAAGDANVIKGVMASMALSNGTTAAVVNADGAHTVTLDPGGKAPASPPGTTPGIGK